MVLTIPCCVVLAPPFFILVLDTSFAPWSDNANDGEQNEREAAVPTTTAASIAGNLLRPEGAGSGTISLLAASLWMLL